MNEVFHVFSVAFWSEWTKRLYSVLIYTRYSRYIIILKCKWKMLPANKIAKFSDQQYSLYQWLDHYDSLSPDKQLRKEDDETTIFDGCDHTYPAISK